ncbi:MAG: cobalamin-binding protein [Steroidobacteraceae bacterium]
MGAAGWSVQDDTGQRLDFPNGPPRRIVSLAPGATALLFAAGAGDRIVGTSDYSDEPEAARAIPRVSDALSLNVERILQLKPDVVVVWENGNSAARIAQLERLKLRIYRHRVARLADLAPALRRLGLLAGQGAQGERAASALEQRLKALRAAYASATPPGVLIQVWDQPVYTVGGTEILSDVLATCGYRNLFAELTTAAPALSVEAVLERKPALILALGPDEATGQQWLERWQRFATLPAVAQGRLVSFSDQRLTRMGPGTVAATEALCARLAARGDSERP